MLTYRDEALLLRTCNVLKTMFGAASVAIHHEFSKCPLNISAFPDIVRFVEKPVKVGWGDIGQVRGEMEAIRLLYQSNQGPDWFYLLSNFCYPIASASAILGDLRDCRVDAFTEATPVGPDHTSTPFQRECFHRYYRHWNIPPKLARRVRYVLRAFRQRSLFSKRSIFGPDLTCYVGSEWIAGNRDVAEYLIETYDSRPDLLAHYAKTYIPTESYYATVLGNSPHFKLSNRPLRYIDWGGKGTVSARGPKVLEECDFDRLVSSQCHFGRKFYSGRSAKLLDLIDKHIGLGAE